MHGDDPWAGPFDGGELYAPPPNGGGRGGLHATELLKRRRTKIIATLGPATADAASVRQLIAAGVDVFRLNMSHGDQEGHAAALALVRQEAAAAGAMVAVLADLCGPKIRVGRFEGGRFELVDGASVVITVRDVLGGDGIIPSQYAGFTRDVVPRLPGPARRRDVRVPRRRRRGRRRPLQSCMAAR